MLTIYQKRLYNRAKDLISNGEVAKAFFVVSDNKAKYDNRFTKYVKPFKFFMSLDYLRQVDKDAMQVYIDAFMKDLLLNSELDKLLKEVMSIPTDC